LCLFLVGLRDWFGAGNPLNRAGDVFLGVEYSYDIMMPGEMPKTKQALQDAGRRVIRLHLGSDAVGSLRKLAEMLA
jgi:hypothetical protein